MNESSYNEKLDWLFNQLPVFQKVGERAYKPSLDNTKKLIDLFQIPLGEMKFIHVAGTNGKGTTCSIIASTLTESGKKVGLFTSPHIKDFRERIRINGKMIPKDTVQDYIDRIRHCSFNFSPSFFEMTWAISLDYFYRNNCDIVVVETGLGGRLDATNIIHPLVSVITNIGLDHINILGDTRKAIAFEKAGIIKKNIPVIIGEKDKETEQVFVQKAKEMEAEIYFLPSKINESYLEANRRLAFSALDLLASKIGKITPTLKAKAIANLSNNSGLYGRFQIINKNPLIIVDAAHNEMGIKRFINDFKRKYTEKSVHLLYGASNDKNYGKIISLFPREWRCYFTTFSSNRSCTVEQLMKCPNNFNVPSICFSDAKTAFLTVKDKLQSDDVLLVLGSFYLLEDILAEL